MFRRISSLFLQSGGTRNELRVELAHRMMSQAWICWGWLISSIAPPELCPSCRFLFRRYSLQTKSFCLPSKRGMETISFCKDCFDLHTHRWRHFSFVSARACRRTLKLKSFLQTQGYFFWDSKFQSGDACWVTTTFCWDRFLTGCCDSCHESRRQDSPLAQFWTQSCREAERHPHHHLSGNR